MMNLRQCWISVVILSLHIPKTADTPFRMALRQRLGQAVLMAYRGKVFNTAGGVVCQFEGLQLKELNDKDAKLLLEYCETHEVQCIHGHFTLSALHGVFAERRCLTFVRDPVDRLLSAYNHMCATAPDLIPAMPFEDFMRLERTRNVYEQVGLVDHLEDVEFVGLTEEYDRSLELLGRKFPTLQGLKATQDGEVKDNFLTRSDITPKLAHELHELNRLDFEIYEAVKGWFLDECKSYGV